jgi:hypothetical protein
MDTKKICEMNVKEHEVKDDLNVCYLNHLEKKLQFKI